MSRQKTDRQKQENRKEILKVKADGLLVFGGKKDVEKIWKERKRPTFAGHRVY